MKLIGMLDSPYVRRAAISLKMLGVPFDHHSVSVFRHFDAFAVINPVVKAPTLVFDDDDILMDSSLIIDYAEALTGKTLMPTLLKDRQRALKIIGLALAASEKTMQIVYELNLRPAEKHHQPWLDRVHSQLYSAYKALEHEIKTKGWCVGDKMTQADVTAAVIWAFTQHNLPDIVKAEDYPALKALSERAEQTPAFQSTPLDG